MLCRYSYWLGNCIQDTNKGPYCSSLCIGEEDPLPLLQNLYPSVSALMSVNGRKLECMVKLFKKGFNGVYGAKLTPNKLKALCEIDWPTFGVGWLLEGSLDKL
jgi:hypothetical protein